MSIMLATLTKKNTHTEKEITHEHKTTKKYRKDSEITQYEKEKVPKKELQNLLSPSNI